MRAPSRWNRPRWLAVRALRHLEIAVSPLLGAATYLGVVLTSRLAIVAQLIVLLMAGIFLATCMVIAGLLSWDLLTH